MAAVDLCGISQDSDALIINEETGGEAYYNATETHPDWPGGASGVTIGCGYDCGYESAASIFGDWGGCIPDNMVKALQGVAGIHGSPASSLAHELHWITVPWNAALEVFHVRDLPLWVGRCRNDLENFDELSGDDKGVLTSVAFNRGLGWNVPMQNDPHGRYSEMRAIKTAMAAKNFDAIPGLILSMRRLWPEGGDLWKRRGHEAALFERGLRGTVRWVQHSLNLLGRVLAEDGDDGPNTDSAVAAWRIQHDLPAGSVMNEELFASLDVALAALPVPTQGA